MKCSYHIREPCESTAVKVRLKIAVDNRLSIRYTENTKGRYPLAASPPIKPKKWSPARAEVRRLLLFRELDRYLSNAQKNETEGKYFHRTHEHHSFREVGGCGSALRAGGDSPPNRFWQRPFAAVGPL